MIKAVPIVVCSLADIERRSYRKEYSEQFILETLDGIIFHVEGKSDKERSKDIENKFTANVYGTSIIMLECAFRDSFELDREGHGEFSVVVGSCSNRLNVRQAMMYFFNLAQHLLAFRTT